jgi:hypothetical protein
MKLTYIQQKFFDAVVKAINDDPELFLFVNDKSNGKSVVLKELDNMFNGLKNDNISIINHENLTNEYKEELILQDYKVVGCYLVKKKP